MTSRMQLKNLLVHIAIATLCAAALFSTVSATSLFQDQLSVRRLHSESSQLPCTSEAACSEKCGRAYENDAAKFPFSVQYTKAADAFTTTFNFQVCSTPCSEGSAFCEPLSQLALRLDTNLVNAPAYIKYASKGSLVSACSAHGLGIRWEGEDLGELYKHHPAGGPVCQTLALQVYHEPGRAGSLRLADVCQQHIELRHSSGASSLPQQAAHGDIASCMVHMALESEAAGFTTLADKEAKAAVEAVAERGHARSLLQTLPGGYYSPAPVPAYYSSPRAAPYYSPSPVVASPPLFGLSPLVVSSPAATPSPAVYRSPSPVAYASPSPVAYSSPAPVYSPSVVVPLSPVAPPPVPYSPLVVRASPSPYTAPPPPYYSPVVAPSPVVVVSSPAAYASPSPPTVFTSPLVVRAPSPAVPAPSSYAAPSPSPYAAPSPVTPPAYSPVVQPYTAYSSPSPVAYYSPPPVYAMGVSTLFGRS